jgi:tetratricopeptide (TPR) repeat protein
VSLLRKLFGGPEAAAPAAGAAQWRSRGNAALSEGKLAEAAECFRQAASADPQDATSRLNLGYALLELGDVPNAHEQLSEALALRRPGEPILHDIRYMLARACRAQRDVQGAIAHLEWAVDVHPSFPEAIDELVQLLHESAAHERALEWAERLRAVRPGVETELLVAQQLRATGRGAEALATLDALGAAGEHGAVDLIRGHALFGLERYEQAGEAYERALAREPSMQQAAASAAAAWWRAGRMDRALDRADDALRLSPGDSRSMVLRANLLQVMGRHDEAIAQAHAAHVQTPQDPELEWTYGAVALAAGDCKRGWPAIEARWAIAGAGSPPDARELGCPAWTGAEPVAGRTLLLVGEQGFGDVFQFVRHATQLQARGAKVVLLVREPVRELLQGSFPRLSVVTRPQDAPRADFHIAMMSVPGALGTTLDTIPADVPYLRADAGRVRQWRERLPEGAGPRVGVVWSGNPAQANDRNRSMSLEQLLRIETPGIQLVNLQRDVRESDRDVLRRSAIWDPSADLHSFSDTAALVESLDLVVSVCTGVAHLAGAMGKPLWVLLAHRPDWRWLLGRDGSPWYPTARLFRQPAPGAWDPVLGDVRAALRELAATGRASA